MAVNAGGEVESLDASVMDSVDWLQRHMDLGRELESGLEAGRFQGVGVCLNIAHQDAYEPGEIPVLALRVLRMPGQPVHIRVHYVRSPDGKVELWPPKVMPGPGPLA